MLEERREPCRSRTQHHDEGVAGDFRRPGDRGVEQRSAGNAHQLFRRAKARRGSGGEHHRVQAVGGARAAVG